MTFVDKLVRLNAYTFERLQFSIDNEDVFLSVQASAYHYCSPRATLAAAQYDEFEVAVIVGDSWATTTTGHLPDVFELLGPYADSPCGPSQVFCRVPKDVVQKVYELLSKKETPMNEQLLKQLYLLEGEIQEAQAEYKELRAAQQKKLREIKSALGWTKRKK
jgi:ABC-type phosphate/phosphonate transport system substrate-binding protein